MNATPVPMPTALLAADVALQNIGDVLDQVLETLHTIDAMTRWLEASESRDRHTGGAVLLTEFGHLRSAIEALVQRDEDYIAREIPTALQDVRTALGLTDGAR
jgi:hypothetical protein